MSSAFKLTFLAHLVVNVLLQYDLSPLTFSPDGRIYQVEYAGKAVDNSGTVLGVKCADGIVLGLERVLLSDMMVAGGANRRVTPVDIHCGMVRSSSSL